MKHQPKSWKPKLPAPTFTNAERYWSAIVLKRAKTFLAHTLAERDAGAESMLCFAIARAAVGRNVRQEEIDVAEKLNLLLKARLKGAPSIRYWLASRGYPAYSEEPNVFEKVQQARHDWVVALMKEMEDDSSP